MIKKTLLGLLAATALAGVASATEYKIAIVQSLTGPVAFIGASVKDGVVLAFDDINASGMLGAGNKITYTVADDAADKGQVLTLISKNAADSSILAQYGPTSGSVAMTAADSANDHKFPVYTMANLPGVPKAGPWANITTQTPNTTIPFIANYAIDKLKIKSCIFVSINDNEAYVTLNKIFMDTVLARGVKQVLFESMKQSETDFSALAVKVADSKADCLYISAPAGMAANMISQFRQAGMDPNIRIIGHSSLNSPDLVRIGGAAVEGVYLFGDWAPGGINDAGRKFDAEFRARYNKESDNWAPVGYSAGLVIADAIKRAGPIVTRESFNDALGKTKNLPVIVGTGTYSFDENRMPFYGVAVLQVKNGKFVAAP